MHAHMQLAVNRCIRPSHVNWLPMLSQDTLCMASQSTCHLCWPLIKPPTMRDHMWQRLSWRWSVLSWHVTVIVAVTTVKSVRFVFFQSLAFVVAE